ncbi:MAG: hypothetical protein A2044_07150 [Candidatus Firestonebacteria bacterium GWA2_43_8]|nr:MAG: hypothetical protein A2044_07150 [Candidatus Firestonebacteria bacterium GWA2_43_8]
MENFQYLKPPPREIPLSIKLQLLFGERITATLVMCALFLVPMYYFSLNWEDSIFKIILWAFYAIIVVSIIYGLYRGKKDINIFTGGTSVSGKILDKNIIGEEGGVRALVLNYEYRISGKTYTKEYSKTIKAHEDPSIFDNTSEFTIICLQEEPSKMVLVESYKAKFFLDEDGNMRMKRPFLGYFQLTVVLISLAAIAAEIYYMLQIASPK